MAILWFGAGGGAGIMITAYAAFFPIVTNTLGGVARIRSSLVVAARTLGASQWVILRRIILPGALPLIFVGLRLGIGLAWAAVIAAELATGQSTNEAPGIGYLMYLNFAVDDDVNAIVAMMAAIGASALIADVALRWLHRRLVHWPAEH
jgi:NitT/TauT family transport system permease protein/taurine transport system permease protein/sulfonate transport system permease protein